MGKQKMGVIYKATNVKNGKIYVGATSRTVEVRRNEHKYNAFRRGLEYEMYEDMVNDGWNSFKWEVIEEVKIDELHEKEKYWITKLEANKNGNYNDLVWGEGHQNAKLDEEAVKKIRVLLMMNEMLQNEIAEIFGVTCATISNIKSGKTWSHLGNEEEFAEMYVEQLKELYGDIESHS